MKTKLCNLPSKEPELHNGIMRPTALVLSLGLLGGLGAVLSAASANDHSECAPPDSIVTDVETGAGHLATLLRDDGTCVQFNEVEPGEIAVVGMGPSDALPPSAMFPGLDKMNLLDLYEALSDGEVAPVALLAAQRRVDRIMATQPIDDIIEPPANKAGSQNDLSLRQSAQPLISASSTLSGGDFESMYCKPLLYSFSRCRTNKTGNTPLIEERLSLGEVYSHPYRGDIHVRLEYHNLLGWHDTCHYSVAQGVTTYCLGYGSTKNRRANVHKGIGDGYHWVFQGN